MDKNNTTVSKDLLVIGDVSFTSNVFKDIKAVIFELILLNIDGSNVEYTRGSIEVVASFLKPSDATICSNDTKILIAKYVLKLDNETICQL